MAALASVWMAVGPCRQLLSRSWLLDSQTYRGLSLIHQLLQQEEHLSLSQQCLVVEPVPLWHGPDLCPSLASLFQHHQHVCLNGGDHPCHDHDCSFICESATLNVVYEESRSISSDVPQCVECLQSGWDSWHGNAVCVDSWQHWSQWAKMLQIHSAIDLLKSGVRA